MAEALPSARQMDILLFLQLVGPSDAGDVAFALRLAPGELSGVPEAFRDAPGEVVAVRELEILSRMGLVIGDGVAWELTCRGREVLAAYGNAD